MTAQSPDRILVNGFNHQLFTNPLQVYNELHRPDIIFVEDHLNTGGYRGYIAEWEIDERKLFLLNVVGNVSYKGRGSDYNIVRDKVPASFKEIFGQVSERIFANWCSGELRIPIGDMTEYIHAGYASCFPECLIIPVVNGKCGEKQFISGEVSKEPKEVKSRPSLMSLITGIESFNKFTSLSPSAFALGLWIGLKLPDLDLLALPVLHHRSILTHSILIPWLLHRFLKNRISELGIAGLYVGIAVHLSADCLSSLVGFGMIWLPWPLKIPMGGASPSWILVNTLLGIWFALKIAPNKRKLVIGMMLLVALAYAVLNEAAILPFVVFGALVSMVALYQHYRKRKDMVTNKLE